MFTSSFSSFEVEKNESREGFQTSIMDLGVSNKTFERIGESVSESAFPLQSILQENDNEDGDTFHEISYEEDSGDDSDFHTPVSSDTSDTEHETPENTAEIPNQRELPQTILSDTLSFMRKIPIVQVRRSSKSVNGVQYETDVYSDRPSAFYNRKLNAGTPRNAQPVVSIKPQIVRDRLLCLAHKQEFRQIKNESIPIYADRGITEGKIFPARKIENLIADVRQENATSYEAKR